MHVAIAGAGIAGLCAAIALAQGGASVEVFERAGTLEETGAGIQLSPNAMAVLERLGVASELTGRLFEPAAVEIREAARGRLLARIPLGDAARRRYGSPYGVIARADLQGALLSAAGRDGRIVIRLGAEVGQPEPASAGIRFDAGVASCSADVLVAADGIHSAIRTGFFGYPGPRGTGLNAWRIILPVDGVPNSISRESTGLWLAPGSHLVHYPIRGGAELNVVVIARAQSTAAPPAEPFGPLLQPLLATNAEWRIWAILAGDPDRPWTKERVVLIGDSAHATLPTAAQGGAQAIEDAWVLARSLCACARDPAGGLAAFERARRARVSQVVREGRRNLAIYGLSGIPAALRNAAISALPPRLHLRRLDWLYGWRPAEFVSRVEHL